MQNNWMKISLAVFSLLILLGALGIALAVFGWSLPGSTFFPIQDRLEQILIVGSTTKQADRYLSLVERRIANLQTRVGSSHEEAALEALGVSLDRAYQTIRKIPDDQIGDQLTTLIEHLQETESALYLLADSSFTNTDKLAGFQARLDQMIIYLGGDVGASSLEHQQEYISQMGTTLDGASLVRAFFPLTGGHSNVECLDCHISGQLEGINTSCIGCHVDVTPAGHYHATCDICHTVNNWQEITWDHSAEVASDCQNCHEWTAPLVHYTGQCSNCHVITGWEDGTDYHTETANCWACHVDNVPTNHYPWQCSTCHSVDTWSDAEPVSYSLINNPIDTQPGHVDSRCIACHGVERCSSCHGRNKPTEHYIGQCSQCHNSDDWNNVTFLHTPEADCLSCHADTAPANHYPRQCSACHTFDGWSGAIFNHIGFTDCRNCHTSTAPVNHYPGQCSNCHNPAGWADITFSHIGLTDCRSCHADIAPPNHYDGQCSLCHNPSGWEHVSFNHTGLIDCISCHATDAPPDHFDGQCSECHTPTTWSDINFSHDGYTDCISCHEDDRPDDHPLAQCSNCHNTSSWDDVKNEIITLESISLLDGTIGFSCATCH